VPIVILAFNRPDLTEKVLSRVLEIRPETVYFVRDGPRSEEDRDPCREVADLFERPLEGVSVKKIVSDVNLGCEKRVVSGLNTVFDEVESAIILEDDCLPDLSFFRYCEELLNHYRDDKRVMTISGNSFQPPSFSCPASYYFSIFSHIWGWATWRRAWNQFDFEMGSLDSLGDQRWLQHLTRCRIDGATWSSIFDKTKQGEINSWGYRWLYSCWAQSALTCLPKRNLVENIGYDERATNTKTEKGKPSPPEASALEFPLIHPETTVQNYRADDYTQRYWFGGNGIRAKAADLLKRISL